MSWGTGGLDRAPASEAELSPEHSLHIVEAALGREYKLWESSP